MGDGSSSHQVDGKRDEETTPSVVKKYPNNHNKNIYITRLITLLGLICNIGSDTHGKTAP